MPVSKTVGGINESTQFIGDEMYNYLIGFEVGITSEVNLSHHFR